ncbi:AarF/ABC1/UbiB kinase family protein [Arcicella rosea]|uniref:Putative unusual protein kinase regulating ubiquinone biosynthesis (AarF/ABC1/UbiB family) n=1 Tax=Arcicella rosea TaxID=502909 RepID=A0A841ENL7_9BACT|nr:AarF/ABC1/UbiB kinase family protein [Arcicella rosea]MBB6005677.1 putative unusual protein kinase regulating ubiquinone biosynthesis (AarF/ABC1/UbiB family) [Arcicella rosea]
MKEQNSIPTSKVARATKFVKTGVKIGGNYLKHNVKKMIDPTISRDELHQDNATDIYSSLSEMKGSALKVTQMLSMDKGMLPRAYREKFAMSQYSAPPLSGPLVMKTFKKHFGKSPQELYDTFDINASNAASIGQVHKATKDGKPLAVKVQYPGVSESIGSDLKMIRPIAIAMFGLNENDVDRYMGEVAEKLIEETDYLLELKRSVEISEACNHIDGLFFPKYYAELSCEKIMTMDWLEGFHLNEFLKTNPSQEIRNKIGQALWDFYDFQIHTLRKVHADPHPGNFLMREDGTMGVIDFGCIKVINDEFYDNYFALINFDTLDDNEKTTRIFKTLDFITKSDSEKEAKFFTELFKEMIFLLGKPFAVEEFDFADDEYFESVYLYAEKLQNLDELKSSKVARGSQHGLYINRTYFGLYSILNELKAKVTTTRPEWLRSNALKVC